VVTILHEINDQYQIDTAMVFLAGFSGGGRAASSIAADHPAIKGVISCGAGLAEPGKFGVERKIPFAGIIGNRDMNFEEMVALQQRLEQINNPNIFIYNETGHQWPPMESFGAALDWIMCVTNYPGVHGFDQEIWRAALAEKDSGRLYLSWLTAKELKKIPGLEKTADSFLLSLARQDGFKNDEKEFFTALEDERTFMDEFTIVFNQAVFTLAPLESTDVFKAKASKLDKWVNSRKKYYRLSALRCRDLCWRLCAEYYGQFVADKNYTQADKLAVISAFFQQSPMKLKRFEKTNQ
jgi:pimeloyl-ACP methyl ester carboxylesterase